MRIVTRPFSDPCRDLAVCRAPGRIIMLEMQLKDTRELSHAMYIISHRFGFWTTLRVLVSSALRRRREAHELALLDNWVRRDIGLPEIDVEPQIDWLHRWDGRL